MWGWRRTSFSRVASATDGEVAGAALLQQQREEVDLEQHVAQLVQQLRVVTGVRGVGQLVRLLDGVRDDAALVLLAVPRALAPQAAGDRVELEQRVAQPLVLGSRHQADRLSCRRPEARPAGRRRPGARTGRRRRREPSRRARRAAPAAGHACAGALLGRAAERERSLCGRGAAGKAELAAGRRGLLDADHRAAAVAAGEVGAGAVERGRCRAGGAGNRLLLARWHRRRGRRGGLTAVAAVGDHVVGRAVGARPPVVAEGRGELVELLLLLLRDQQLLDPLLGLLEALLGGLGDLRDAEDVVAGVGLDRADDLLRDRGEHRGVELRVLLALGDAQQLAALLLRGGVVGDGPLRPSTTSRRSRRAAWPRARRPASCSGSTSRSRRSGCENCCELSS